MRGIFYTPHLSHCRGTRHGGRENLKDACGNLSRKQVNQAWPSNCVSVFSEVEMLQSWTAGLKGARGRRRRTGGRWSR